MPPSIPSFSPEAPREAVLWSEPFDTLDPRRWREVELQNQTEYDVVNLEGQPCLRARARHGASILLASVRFKPSQYPWLSWRWRIQEPVKNEDLTTRGGSDASARVYVYYESGGLPWQKRNVDFIWSSVLPLNTVLSSPFASSSKIIAVDGGMETAGKWRIMERNLFKDYETVFGAPPSRVIALGVMTDTDTMGGDALAYYDELRVSREPLLTHPQ